MKEPQEAYQEEANGQETYTAKLTTEELESDPKAQDSVGSARVMDLLKELESARKERDNDPMEGAPKGDSADIGDTENSKSTIGS